MPRKKKTKEEKERIIEKPALSQEEINSLEQRLEKDEEEIDFSDIKEFLQQPETPRISPSLGKINSPQRNPVRLERNLAEIPAPNFNNNQIGNEEENGLNYIPKGIAEEPKYIQYSGKIVEDIISRAEIPNIGRGNPFERREIGLQNTTPQENLEKYIPIKKVDRERIGKEKPFERKEIKYTHEKY